MVWRQINAVGQLPRARERHAAGFIGKRMYVFGGVCDSHIFDDLLYFDIGTPPSPLPTPRHNNVNVQKCGSIETESWFQIREPDNPRPMAGHSLSIVDQKLLLIGGTGAELYCFELGTYISRPAPPLCRFEANPSHVLNDIS